METRDVEGGDAEWLVAQLDEIIVDRPVKTCIPMVFPEVILTALFEYFNRLLVLVLCCLFVLGLQVLFFLLLL